MLYITKKVLSKQELHIKNNSPKVVHRAGVVAVRKLIKLPQFNIRLGLDSEQRDEGFDYIFERTDSGNKYKVRVCATTNESKNVTNIGEGLFWRLGIEDEEEKPENLYYCFIQMRYDEDSELYFCRFFIVPPKIVSEFITTAHKYYLSKGKNRDKTSKNRYFVIGSRDTDLKYEISVPMQQDYEDMFDLMK